MVPLKPAQRRIIGEAEVVFVVNQQGMVERVVVESISTPEPRYRDQVIRLVEGQLYAPQYKNGVAIKVRYKQKVPILETYFDEDEIVVDSLIDWETLDANTEISAGSLNNMGILFASGISLRGKSIADQQRWIEETTNTFFAPDWIAEVALLFELSKGLKLNSERALKCFEASRKYSNTNAMYKLGQMYFLGDNIGKEVQRGIDYYREAANAGMHRAESSMGWLYANGKIGSEPDFEKAADWYLRAMKGGDLIATNNLGSQYENGQGVEQNMAEAIRLYHLAASKGFLQSMVNLGDIYFFGENGIPLDYEKALSWYEAPARNGDVTSALNMGFAYQYGHGVSKDEDTAVEYYLIAAKSNHKAALNNLGRIYKWRGEYDTAMTFFQRAVDLGHAKSMHNMGNIWHYREDGKADEALGQEWFRRGAKAGFSLSQFTLANELMKAGKNEEAIYWLLHADYNGIIESKGSLDWYRERGYEIPELKPEDLEYLNDPNRTVMSDFNFWERGIVKLENKDYEYALKYFMLSLKKGYIRSAYYVGYMYENGLGVPRSDEEAIKYYMWGAERGEPKAILGLEKHKVQ